MLGVHDTRLVVLYVGRLTEEKGIAQLIPLCNNPKFRLVLVGGGHQEDHARALFAHTDAHFTGVLRGEELIDAYTAADVFVFPSQSESFGLAPLEAMACGLPVVAPFVGGLQDTLIPDHNCLVYDPERSDSLKETVLRLVEDAALRTTISEHAAQYAATRSNAASMQQLITLYRQLAHVH